MALSGHRGAAVALRCHQAGAALSNPAARLAGWGAVPASLRSTRPAPRWPTRRRGSPT